MTRTYRILLALLACSLLTCAAFAQAGDRVEDLPGFDPDRYIVKFRMDIPMKASRADFVKAMGATRVYHDLEGINAVAVELPAAALKALANNRNVDYVERDLPRYAMAQTTPYGIVQSQASLVSPGAGNRLVCIIDSGFDAAHEDLGNNVSGYNGNLPWATDGFGHGTHVAGTISALDNNIGVIGVWPGVDLYIVRVFGDDGAWAYSSTLIDAAQRCSNAGANVVSMSLGCSGRRCSSTSERAQFDNMWNAGMISVAAAGNDGNTSSSYPASYDSVISVAALDSSNVVATFSQQNSQVEIGAAGVGVKSTLPMGLGTDESATVDGTSYEVIALTDSASGTGSGPLVDCGDGSSTCPGGGGQVCLIERGTISFAEKVAACEAGGGDAAIIYNNVAGNFSGTLGGAATAIQSVSMSQADGQFLAANKLGTTASVTTAPGNYASWDGTSMATPHVSGVAALIWSHDTSWTNQQVRDCINATALDLGAAGRDNAYGFGLIQAQDALNGLIAGTCGGGGTPTCEPVGASCTSNADCCSNSCKGKTGAKTCK